MRFSFAVSFALLIPSLLLAQPVHIAATAPLSPEQERQALTVPPGFEVQLVAAEPDIDKPIQCAFDAKGRLWVTTSRHYPFMADPGKGTDKLFVLSDFDINGKARKIEVFANDLNIPIGILPLPDCKSCIVHSIPSVWKYTDTDGDGKADKKEELLTGFGTDDTHGMVNSFTLMPDGWVYATHGFKNTSVVKDRAGHTITMNSGNTFRFRPDGSNLEQFTYGQVNPFGIAIDPWFNLYTADCHTKPITQLIRGATYASFAKPHGGLGYAPHVTEHSHNSTAICGLAWYDADHYPLEYRGRMFLGNVVTNRVNADVIEWKGSTPVAVEKPDFLVSKDPWFRPIDIKLGPNGALYITDFYNRIIGHYEVPLNHPQRDKDHGRVWRVVWKGLDGKAPPAQKPFKDLTTETAEKLDELLGHANITVRLMATQELIRRGEVMKTAQRDSKLHTVHRQWADEGIAAKGMAHQQRAAATSDPFIASHEERMWTAREEWARERPPTDRLQSAKPDLVHADPHVARAIVDRMTAIPNASHISSLVALIKQIPAEDTHLRYAARVALRNSVMAKDGWVAAAAPENRATVASIALGIPSREAAHFLTKQEGTPSDAVAEFVGRYGAEGDWHFLFTPHSPRPLDQDLKLITALARGLQAAGVKHAPSLHDSRGLIQRGLEHADPAIARLAVQALSALETIDNYESDRKTRSMTMSEPLTKWLLNRSAPAELRAEAYEIAVRFYFDEMTTPIRALLEQDKIPAPLLEKVASSLASNAKALDMKPVRDAIREVLKTASYRVAVSLATSLAGHRDGADALLASIEQGQAPARLLQEKPILDRLRATKVKDLDQRVSLLTKNLPPVEQRITDLIGQRSRAFAKAKPNVKLGAELFAKNCAACHQINSQGGKVGPNLDGIGSRGAERLLEDILDPNRNVDAAFRARTLTLADGRTVSGLLLRVEGKVLVMANAEGKEVRVPEDDVEKNVITNLSPMPANMETALPQKEFLDLLGYLLEQRPK